MALKLTENCNWLVLLTGGYGLRHEGSSLSSSLLSSWDLNMVSGEEQKKGSEKIVLYWVSWMVEDKYDHDESKKQLVKEGGKSLQNKVH